MAAGMRIALARHVMEHSQLEMGGNNLAEWVAMERKMPLRAYAQRMAIRGWGGAVEIAAFAHLAQRQVHIFERTRVSHEYKCIAQFGDARRDNIVYLHYEGRSHYNVLIPELEPAAPGANGNHTREAVRP